jgi:hypothetical protein
MGIQYHLNYLPASFFDKSGIATIENILCIHIIYVKNTLMYSEVIAVLKKIC